MPSKPVTSALGLYRTPNPLGGAQDGGYQSLQNCVIRSKDTIEPRLGQFEVASWIGSNSTDTRRINALFSSSLGTFAQYGSGSASGIGLLESLGTAILSNVDPPSVWLRTKHADCMKRAYFTSSAGLKRIDSSSAGAAAGGPRATLGVSHFDFSIVPDSSGQMALDSARMYRAELVRYAPDGAEIVGPPSGRCVIRIPPARTTTATGNARVGNVVTVTTTAAHGFQVGDTPTATFNAADTDPNEFDNGVLPSGIASVPSSTTFTYAQADADYTSTAAATYSLGPAYAIVRVYLSDDTIAGDVVRLYRSEAVTGYLSAVPDDVYKVFEAKLTSTHISQGYITIDENTPEVLLGDPAYFSPSVEGEGQSNETPPLMHDVCSLGDQLFGVNLLDPHRLELRLIATGGSTGIINGTTIVFTRGSSTFTLTASTSLSGLGDGKFWASTASGSVSRDIESTALWLVDAINLSTTNSGWIRAEYISTPDAAPGKILLTATDFSTTAFTVTSDKGQAWAPYILNTGTATSSRQVPDYADICWSKPGQPDAWPAGNRARVGSPSEYALRCLATREKVIVLKEKSAHLVSPGPRIDPLDDTCEFPLPDTAAVMDNQVYCLSSIGVVAVSEGGVVNMGSPIEGDMRAVIEQALRVKSLIAASYTNIHCLASWGASDEIEHRYLLGIPALVGAGSATPTTAQKIDNIWVFNGTARAWSGPWPTKHRHAASWVSASSSSRMVFARDDKPGCLKEQGLDAPESLRYSDYFGETATTLYDNGTGDIYTYRPVDNTNAGINIGDALYVVATGVLGVISSLAGTYGVQVHEAGGFSSNPSVLLLRKVPVRVEPVKQSADSFPQGKHVTGFNLALSDARFQVAKVYMGNERSGDREAKQLSRPGFGAGTFGETPFGDPPGLLKERGQAPKGAARGDFHTLAFVVEEAGAFFRLHSFALDFEVGSQKNAR